MKPDDIDEALGGDKRIEPSAAFSGQVMRVIRARANAGQAPGWIGRLIWPVVSVTSVAGALLLSVSLAERSAVRPEETAEVVQWLSIVLTGTFAIAWRSNRRFV